MSSNAAATPVATWATTPFLADIMAQPASLRALSRREIAAAAEPLADMISRRDRIVLTGMGASLAALKPLWLDLVADGYPAWLIETAELLDGGAALIGRSTLVFAASQSGRSAEIVALATQAREAGAALVAITNDTASPLAQDAAIVLPIHAGAEHAVSTKTYLNTLAVGHLVARAIRGRGAGNDLDRAADGVESYLAEIAERLGALKAMLGLPERLYIVGRGASLAAAECGALILKEAAKWPAEGMSVPQFRHGPLELADGRLSLIVLAGEGAAARERNRRFLADVRGYGAQGAWMDDKAEDDGDLAMPAAATGLRCIAEIVPLQLLSIAIAEQAGIEAGRFRHLGKVTTVE